MDIREFRYIAEIGKTKHMMSAAQNLYISQPALHKTLRKVESELGMSLFFRRGNELWPTDTGEIVLKTAREVARLMGQMNNAIEATKDLKCGRVALGFPSIVGTLYLPEILIQFKAKYPGISLYTFEAGGRELTDRVVAQTLDMAIVMRPIYSSALNEVPLIKNQVVVAVSKDSPLASRQFVTLKDLADVPFNTFDASFNMCIQLVERFHAENITPTFAIQSASCQFLQSLSRRSGTPLILPRPLIDFYDDDSNSPLVKIPFQPAFPWELCLIFPKNTALSAACKAMISHIQESFLAIQ